MNRITFFKNYYLDSYNKCANYNEDYNNTYNRLVSTNQNIRYLVDVWVKDYESEKIGIGPNFTLIVEHEGGFFSASNEVYKDFMIEAAYRDYILENLDYERKINFYTSDFNVANQIIIKLKKFQNEMVH